MIVGHRAAWGMEKRPAWVRLLRWRAIGALAQIDDVAIDVDAAPLLGFDRVRLLAMQGEGAQAARDAVLIDEGLAAFFLRPDLDGASHHEGALSRSAKVRL